MRPEVPPVTPPKAPASAASGERLGSSWFPGSWAQFESRLDPVRPEIPLSLADPTDAPGRVPPSDASGDRLSKKSSFPIALTARLTLTSSAMPARLIEIGKARQGARMERKAIVKVDESFMTISTLSTRCCGRYLLATAEKTGRLERRSLDRTLM